MASVLHRTTKQFRQSVNTPDFPVVDWIINPDLSAVTGFQPKYWIITGDVVTLMDKSTRDTVDTTDLSKQRDDATSGALDNLEAPFRALVLLMIDEINVLRTVHGLSDRTIAQFKTAMRNKLGT